MENDEGLVGRRCTVQHWFGARIACIGLRGTLGFVRWITLLALRADGGSKTLVPRCASGRQMQMTDVVSLKDILMGEL